MSPFSIGCLSGFNGDIMKVGLLKCREEPPKLLQGTKFQDRTFQIKEHKLLLLKDKKVGGQPPSPRLNTQWDVPVS